ncbi:MAG: hypothetical protein ACFFCS_06350 [Candidatus Hodarchaeota archaeon]
MVSLAGILLLVCGVIAFLNVIFGDWAMLFPGGNYSPIQWPLYILSIGNIIVGLLLVIAAKKSD